jgi:hypothetical protein
LEYVGPGHSQHPQQTSSLTLNTHDLHPQIARNPQRKKTVRFPVHSFSLLASCIAIPIAHCITMNVSSSDSSSFECGASGTHEEPPDVCLEYLACEKKKKNTTTISTPADGRVIRIKILTDFYGEFFVLGVPIRDESTALVDLWFCDLRHDCL